MPEIVGNGLYEAILAVQKDAPTLPKDAVNPHFQSSYTPLDTIVEQIGPILNKHGLVWMTFPTSDDDGKPALMYKLIHAPSGEHVSGLMPLLLSKQDAQGMGSAITYARRYSLCAVLNLVADDDDDGNRATTASGATSPANEPPTAPQLRFLKTLVSQNRPPDRTMRAMLDNVGAEDVEYATGWASKITKAQASMLIEAFRSGSLPDPDAQDIPVDQPELPEVGDDSDLPFDATHEPMSDAAADPGVRYES